MSVRILVGDARERIRELPDGSVHMVVTSPPYHGLRDYQTGTWAGGDPACRHVVGQMRRGLGLATSVVSVRGGGHKVAETPDIMARQVCPHCGARRVDQQMGMEGSLQDYIAELVALFREIRRVLRDDGTVWLNLGDAYFGGGRGGNSTRASSTLQGSLETQEASMTVRSRARVDGFKEKDLMLVPARVAIALQDDGWYLRQDIVWAKPNPMPESVTDRCTKSHEFIFLLTKSERYFYDNDAVMEGLQTDPKENYPARAKITGRGTQGGAAARGNDRDRSGGFPPRMVGANGPDRPSKGVPNGALSRIGRRGLTPRHSRWTISCDQAGLDDVGRGFGRNKRSVWTVATTPFDGEFCKNCSTFFQGDTLSALKVERFEENGRKIKRRYCTCGSHTDWLGHFATFPAALIEPCILAGCPEDGVVLDPFGGAGTTALVCERLQRDCILIELNPHYAEMAAQRIRRAGGLLALVEMVPLAPTLATEPV